MFYDNFIKLCAKREIKPTPLVTSMGLSSSNVSQWRDGSIPRADVLLKLSDYLGVSMRYLLTGEEEKPAGQDASELNEQKIELMNLFDQFQLENQLELLGYARGLAAGRKSQDSSKGGK